MTTDPLLFFLSLQGLAWPGQEYVGCILDIGQEEMLVIFLLICF